MDPNFWFLLLISFVKYIHGNELIEQWVSSVQAFSSQYSQNGWSAWQIVGEPNTPTYGDISTAWTPKSWSCTAEFIEVEFPQALVLHELQIYETHYGGGITHIEAQLWDDAWRKVYTRNPSDPRVTGQIRVYSPPLSDIPEEKVRVIRISINCCLAGLCGYTEIDAVKMIGYLEVDIVDIFEYYPFKCIHGYNDLQVSAASLATIRDCYDECVTKSPEVTNSIDYHYGRQWCICQSVNYTMATLAPFGNCNSYQKFLSITDAKLFSVTPTRSSHIVYATTVRLRGAGGSKPAMLIVSPGTVFPAADRQPVATKDACVQLCLASATCTAFLLEGPEGSYFCTPVNNLE